MKKVKDISLSKDLTVVDLVKQFHDVGGFTAKKLAVASDVLKKMEGEKDCFKFLSFPACITATGIKSVVRDLVKEKKFDAIITTPGTVVHDLARLWQDYYEGSFEADDKKLYEEGINRLGNVFIPNSSYGEILEKRLQPIFKKIYDSVENKVLAPYELVWKIGEQLENEPNKEDSIVYWCYKNKVPMFLPGITDGALGFQLIMFRQDHKDFKIDVFKDESLLEEIVFTHKNTGALMIGGGISKHHVIWWNQFKDGLDYAVYLTTAVEYDGSLSGARVREAVSWGKVKPDAKYITVEGEATILLPLLASQLL